MKNIRNTVLSIMEGVITVKVKFNETDKREYSYLALITDGYQKDDVAVVEHGDSHRMVKVTSVDDECDVDTQSDIEYKFLLARIDMKSHEAKLAKVEQAVSFFRQKQRQNDRAAARAAMLDSLGVDAKQNLLLSFDNKETDAT